MVGRGWAKDWREGRMRGVDLSTGLEVVSNFFIQFHLLIRESDIGMERTLLMRLFG